MDEGTRVIVSYDVDGVRRSLRSKVHRIVFGYRTVRETATGRKEYTYAGFADLAGFRYLGQSVIALPPDDAKRLARRLASLGIKHSATPVLLLD